MVWRKLVPARCAWQQIRCLRLACAYVVSYAMFEPFLGTRNRSCLDLADICFEGGTYMYVSDENVSEAVTMHVHVRMHNVFFLLREVLVLMTERKT